MRINENNFNRLGLNLIEKEHEENYRAYQYLERRHMILKMSVLIATLAGSITVISYIINFFGGKVFNNTGFHTPIWYVPLYLSSYFLALFMVIKFPKHSTISISLFAFLIQYVQMVEIFYPYVTHQWAIYAWYYIYIYIYYYLVGLV